MGYFDIAVNTLTKQLLPTRVRSAKMKAWCRVLVTGVRDINDKFVTMRTDNVYTLTHNSQVYSIEAVLNDAFDAVNRDIYLGDPITNNLIYLAVEAEFGTTAYESPRWLGTAAEEIAGTGYEPNFIYTPAETITGGYDFLIYVPGSVTYDLSRFTALVSKFKLPSKTWNIITY